MKSKRFSMLRLDIRSAGEHGLLRENFYHKKEEKIGRQKARIVILDPKDKFSK